MHKKQTFNLLILFVFFFTQQLSYVLAQSPAPANAKSLDIPITPFAETINGKAYLKQNNTLPPIRDAWGYPPRDNIYKKLKPKTNPKSTFLHKFFNLISIESAHAYDFEDEVNLPGVVNCRPNQTTTSYFKAYFEDMAVPPATGVGIGNDVGYDHPDYGPARRQAVCEVLQEIAAIIMLNQQPNSQITVIPDILFPAGIPADMPATALAAATAYNGLSTSTLDNGTLHRHITTKQDPTPDFGSFDAFVITNFGPGISWSVDSSLNSNTYDFKTVMRHEILHALGFRSLLPSAINNQSGNILHTTLNEYFYQMSPISESNRYFIFPQPLSPVLNSMISGSPPSWFKNNQTVYQGRKNIFGASPDGVRAIYSPSSWQQGSSLSHFDSNRAPLGNTYVMHPSIFPGVSKNIHLHEREVLCHLGYQVSGLSDCEKPTPVAKDDIITSVQLNQCVPFLQNDLSFSGGFLSLYNLQVINLPSGSTLTYFSSPTDCSSQTNDPSNAKSIKINNNSSLQSVSIRYRVKDSISNRISEPGLINLSNCATDSNELVCNGKFELGRTPNAPSNLHQGIFANGWVPYWYGAESTPDLIFKNPAWPSTFPFNLPYAAFPSSPANLQTQVDMVDSGSYAANIVNTEKITTKLRAPLVVGESYTLSFDVSIIGRIFGANVPIVSTLTNLNVLAGLSVNCIGSDTATLSTISTCFSPSPASSSQTIVNQVVPVNKNIPTANWTHVTKNFVATEPFAHLVFYLTNTTSNIPVFLDNISIKKVSSTNSISGKIYNDYDLDGQQDPGEPGISGLSVGLFSNSNSSTPIFTVTTSNNPQDLGSYFINIPPPILSNYFVAIVPENSVSSVTQPTQNSLLTGYSFARQVAIPSSGSVTGQNFGVLLPGQYSLQVTSTIQESCTGNSINLTVSGGQGPYSYLWSNGATGPTISGVVAGTYTAIITDSGGVSATASATISINPISLAVNVVHATAPNFNNGKITSTITGGTPPYIYYGSAVNAAGLLGPTSSLSVSRSNISGNPNTIYSVYAKDSLGCMTNAISNLRVLNRLSVNASVKRHCEPSIPNSSRIFAIPAGGHEPYSWTWKKNGTPISQALNWVDSGIHGIGSYEVQVTDSSGQQNSATVTMPSTPPVPFSGVVTHATGSANNGAISITIPTEYIGGYQYYWHELGLQFGQPSNTLTKFDLAPGSYTVSVKSRDCTISGKKFQVNRVISSPSTPVLINK